MSSLRLVPLCRNFKKPKGYLFKGKYFLFINKKYLQNKKIACTFATSFHTKKSCGMSHWKKITLTRVLHYLFFSLTAATALLLVLELSAYFGIGNEGPFIRGWVTTVTEQKQPILMPHPDGSGDFKLYNFGEQKLVMLEFADMSGLLKARYLGYLFFQNMATALAVFILFQITRIFRNLDRGQFFKEENTRRARRIALAVLVFPFTGYVASRILAGVTYEAGGHIITTARPAAHLDNLFLGVLSALVIFALVEIFNKGAQLQQEQDLTI